MGSDKTLFHYLLTRLGKIGSQNAVEYCLRVLPLRPEETKYILRYLGCFPVSEQIENHLLQCLESAESVYDYQLFEIVKWHYERQARSPRLLSLCRKWMFDRNRPPWHRAYCLAIIGEAADSSDLDLFEGRYAEAATEIERVEILMGLSRMEVGRRNGLLARVKGDGYNTVRHLTCSGVSRSLKHRLGLAHGCLLRERRFDLLMG